MRIRLFYLLALLFAITSCSPRITTDLLRTDEPKGSIDDVELLGEKEPVPADAETPVSGSVQVPAVSGETGRDIDAYLILGGEADFAYSAKSSSSSFVLALGLGFFVTPSLSLELGGSLSSSSIVSDPDITVNGKGLSASLAYHRPLARNLYYVPEFEVDYLNYSAEATNLKYMCLALAPLMVEYRADDSMWGFRAGIGELGIAFSVGGTAAPLKSLYSVNLNSVSFVFVKYF